MAPFYETVCITQLGFKLDEDLLKKMKETNEKDLKAIDEKIEDAEKNLGETEVRDFMLEKAEYLSRIGDKVTNIFSPLVLRNAVWLWHLQVL